jgi:hypothetical protein
MSEESEFTRRGLLQMVGAIVATASFAARRPLFASVENVESLDDEFFENEPVIVTDRASGTKLERFLKSRGIKPAHLARESGYSRAFLLRIRMGRMEPTRPCIAAIALACGRLAREAVTADDLFDLRPRPRLLPTSPDHPTLGEGSIK